MASDSQTAQASAALTLPQLVSSPLTKVALFLVVTINPGDDHRATVLSFGADLSALLRGVGFRNLDGALSCIMGIGSDAWDRLFGLPRPAELHPFREIRSGPRHAVSTAGDLIFHIRAKQMDLCFELAAQIMTRLNGAVSTTDEVQGFRYFDQRDVLGFVDGTEIPRGTRLPTLYSLAAKIRPSPAEATSSSRSTFTISKPGIIFLPKLRRKSSGAPKSLILNWTIPSSPRLHTMLSPPSKRTAWKSKSCAIICPSGAPGVASSVLTSSAIAVRPARSSRCWKTCSSGGRRETTIASSTSALR